MRRILLPVVAGVFFAEAAGAQGIRYTRPSVGLKGFRNGYYSTPERDAAGQLRDTGESEPAHGAVGDEAGLSDGADLGQRAARLAMRRLGIAVALLVSAAACGQASSAETVVVKYRGPQ
jgi:hypothetical protein